jgi:hypothetical protein
MEYLKIEDKEDTDLLRKCVIDNWMELKKKKKKKKRVPKISKEVCDAFDKLGQLIRQVIKL